MSVITEVSVLSQQSSGTISARCRSFTFRFLAFSCVAAFLFATSAHADGLTVDLGTASSYAVLAGTTVTNTGQTTVTGNLGLTPGTSVTGFGPGTVSGAIDAADAASKQAGADLTKAYNSAATATGAINLTGQDLGGLTLKPGVYFFSSSVGLTGKLTLDGGGDPNAVFIFQIGSTLVTASASSVNLINGATGNHVVFQVGSSATLGTGTQFAGNILALTSITLTTGSNISCGSAMAINGAVTMDTNKVSACSTASASTPAAPSPVPEPSSLVLLGTGIVSAAAFLRRKIGV